MGTGELVCGKVSAVLEEMLQCRVAPVMQKRRCSWYELKVTAKGIAP